MTLNFLDAVCSDIFWIRVCQRKDKLALHDFICSTISEMSSKYGLTGNREYGVDYLGRHGLIDVVWEDMFGIPIVAIEVDASRRQKSLEKLVALNAPNLIWVYYGKKKPDISNYIPVRMVKLILPAETL